MTDKEVIQQFYKQIAWADQTIRNSQFAIRNCGRNCKLIHSEIQNQLAIPSSRMSAIKISFRFNFSLTLFQLADVLLQVSSYFTLTLHEQLSGNNCELRIANCELVMTSSNPRVYAKFIDAQAAVLDACLLMKTIEGADLQQTLTNFLAGKYEIAWTWDKGEISLRKCSICNGEGNLTRSRYVQIFPERESLIPPEALYVACDCSLDHEDDENFE